VGRRMLQPGKRRRFIERNLRKVPVRRGGPWPVYGAGEGGGGCLHGAEVPGRRRGGGTPPAGPREWRESPKGGGVRGAVYGTGRDGAFPAHGAASRHRRLKGTLPARGCFPPRKGRSPNPASGLPAAGAVEKEIAR
jgi:hypothetical protein